VPLKDNFETDLDTFINADKFATTHVISGKEMQIILDDDKLKAKQAKSGVYEDDLLFHVKMSVFGDIPAVGQHIDFDGEVFRVSDVQEDDGLLSITLEGYRS